MKPSKITYGNTKFGTKSVELTSYERDKVMSPYPGVVAKTHSPHCNDGYLVIKHIINNEVYYSQYCGINNVLTPLGDKVNGGATLGFFSDKPITYSCLNANLDYMIPNTFLSGDVLKDYEKDTKPKNDDKVEKDPEKDKYEPKDKSKYEINALTPMTLPLEFGYRALTKGAKKIGKELKTMGKGMFSLKNKEKDDRLKKAREDKENEENNQSLYENIERIKKLLK